MEDINMLNSHTGKIEFSGEKIGVYINYADAKEFYGAIHAALVCDRKDPFVAAQIRCLFDILRGVDDDNPAEVDILRPYDECKIRTIIADPLMVT